MGKYGFGYSWLIIARMYIKLSYRKYNYWPSKFYHCYLHNKMKI